ncbi:MAG: DUF86 domain-containing protein [bacterium]
MKDDKIYILHINDSVNRILDYTSNGKEGFFADTKTQDAVVRNLEIIGEAVKNVSSELKLKYTNVPWKSIAGMRDKLIHDYFGVNLELVWDVVETELPKFKKNISSILSS